MIAKFSKRVQLPLVVGLSLLVSAALNGCALLQLRPVDIPAQPVTPLTKHNSPVVTRHGKLEKMECKPAFHGGTQTFAYDPVIWRLLRFPSIQSPDGFLVELDTGLPHPAHVTLDVVAQKRYPAYLGKSIKVAYVPNLRLGSMSVSDFFALIETSTYQVRLFGWPLYQPRAMILGMACLRRVSYLAFDNTRREVTIGMEPFVPSPARHWTSYHFLGQGVHSVLDPGVQIPVAHHLLKLWPDSAGGRHLTINPEQWKEIAPALKISRHRIDRYATWDGFQPVDSYTVDDLPLGPLRLKDEVVFVRSGKDRVVEPILPLGVFQSETVVWDIRHRQFWIGQ